MMGNGHPARRSIRRVIACLVIAVIPALMMQARAAVPTPAATTSTEDLAGIALATSILHTVGDSIWPGWTSAPFRIDLLTADGPVEINFASPQPAPSFPPNLEATFPWADGVPTIVIGEPKFVQAHAPIRWTVTLLHEHFHQWQDAWPHYFSSVAALQLGPKDGNGMWMLDYPFPYADPKVDRAYAALSHQLAIAIAATDPTKIQAETATFARMLHAFSASLPPGNRKYFAFQCWQEGVARYTEFAVARAAAREHSATPSFLSDKEAALLGTDARRTYYGVTRAVNDPNALARDRRVAFYAFGAGEAILLDRVRPNWHADYLDSRLDLSVFF
jgi:hypothetical protein